VAKVTPFKEVDYKDILKKMAGSVLKYDHPMDPVGLEDWEVLK
jgi:hypothetical protein